MIAATDQMLVFAPYASDVVYETWLMPRAHQASFADAGDEVLVATARLLPQTLRALHDDRRR